MLASLTNHSRWDLEGLEIVVKARPATIHLGGFEEELLQFDASILRAIRTPDLHIEQVSAACELLGHEVVTAVFGRLST
jgi:hypothetical protein